MKDKVIWFINTILALVLLTGVTLSHAGGGKAENPLYDADGNMVGQVFSYDAESCVITAIDRSEKYVTEEKIEMAYNDDKTWADLSRDVGIGSNTLITTLVEGQNKYNEWQSFRAGRTNTEIATALGVTDADVANMDSCYSAMLALYNYANNQTPFQSDYLYSLRLFS